MDKINIETTVMKIGSSKQGKLKKSLMICTNRRLNPATISCAQSGGHELAEKIEQNLLREKIVITVVRTPCLGHCEDGPVMRLAPGGEFLLGMNEDEIMERVRAFAAQKTRQT